MKVLSIDPGMKRWGIALGDTDNFTSIPLRIIDFGFQENINTIIKLIHEHQIGVIVIGFPVHMDGTEHSMTRFTNKIIQTLESTGIPIYKVDERLSSFVVEEGLMQSKVTHKKRKKIRDMLTAKLILEDAFREDILSHILKK